MSAINRKFFPFQLYFLTILIITKLLLINLLQNLVRL